MHILRHGCSSFRPCSSRLRQSPWTIKWGKRSYVTEPRCTVVHEHFVCVCVYESANVASPARCSGTKLSMWCVCNNDDCDIDCNEDLMAALRSKHPVSVSCRVPIMFCACVCVLVSIICHRAALNSIHVSVPIASTHTMCVCVCACVSFASYILSIRCV